MDVDTRTEGQVLTGRYVLEQRLGSGGAGVVWRARDLLLERPVAVKLLHTELAHDPPTAARFRSEAASAAKLTHPNAVIVYDIGRHVGRDFLVMELVDGPALSELIAAGPLPADTTAHLGAAIASALGLAHQRGMLHRDVKPANVLLDAAGVPKVADFGIARALGEATARLTAPGSVMGTARYLAPEQLLDGPLDGRVDVYALGLVLHEALTGKAPWGSGTALDIASRRLTGDLRPPSTLREDVPPGLDAVIQRATRLEVDERYADGAAMADALAPFAGPAGRRYLDRLLQGLPPASRPVAANRNSTARPAPVPALAPGPRPAVLASPIRYPEPAREAPEPATPPPAAATRTSSAVGGAQADRPVRPRSSRLGPRVAAHRSRRMAGREASRLRRRRRRMRRLLATLLLVTGLSVVGTQFGVPGVTELTEAVQDSDVGDLLRDVRDGATSRIRG